MKKSLLAVAAIGAFASAAQAQSSVTVYGILDVGYIGSNVREVGAPNAAGTQTTTKLQKSAFGQSAEQTSRLGFKGTEDLGGGASAFFTVELGLNPQSPNLSGGNTANDSFQNTSNNGGSAIDNRQSFVGLKKNGIGQFAFGRQYTPVFNTGAATSPGQYNNVLGDVVYAGATGVWSSATNGNAGGVGQAGHGFTNRASNALTAQSDRFAGFQVGGMYALSNQNTTQTATTGGNNNWNGWGLNGNFTWQKLYVGVAYQSFKTLDTNAVAATAPTLNVGSLSTTSTIIGTAAAAGFPASNISDKQTLAGATYDFGILKAYAQWVGRKVQNDTATATTAAGEQANRNAQQIGVRSYITPAIESWASIGNGKVKSSVGANSVNFVGWQLGSNYYLSKRTNLYAIYGQSQSSSASSAVIGGGNSGNQYALGVRHTF